METTVLQDGVRNPRWPPRALFCTDSIGWRLVPGVSGEPGVLETRERMRIEDLAEGSFILFSKWPKSKMATALRPRRTSSRPISREPAVGAARERMQIEGRAEGNFH